MFSVVPGLGLGANHVAFRSCVSVFPRTLNAGLMAVPEAPPTFGSNWTFKATCRILEENVELAKVVGYDTRVNIAQRVENACRVHKPRRSKCTPAELVLVPLAKTPGEIFFVSSGGHVRKLV